MDENSLSGRIDTTARAGTMLLAAVYGSGFVIVTLHQARFGISAFDLLKPKIFAAGFTFIGLVFLASLTAFRVLRVGWWNIGDSPAHDDGQTKWALVTNTVLHFVACEFAALYVPFLFVEGTTDATVSMRTLMWATVVTATGFLISLAVLIGWRRRNKRLEHLPRVINLGALAAGAAVVACGLFNSPSSLTGWFCIWFFATGLGAVRLHHVISRPEKRLAAEWDRAAPLAFLVVSVYSAVIYPNVRSSLGGGVPVHIVLYFRGQQPLFTGQTLDTNLLEENEKGYYVTSTIEQHRAYFIPRENVAVVKFERQKD